MVFVAWVSISFRIFLHNKKKELAKHNYWQDLNGDRLRYTLIGANQKLTKTEQNRRSLSFRKTNSPVVTIGTLRCSTARGPSDCGALFLPLQSTQVQFILTNLFE